MRNLYEYAAKAMMMLDDCGIPYADIEDFTVNTRSRRWGQCRRENGCYFISVSATLLDERNDEDGLLNTLIHELLHTCPGCWNHGAAWQQQAQRVENAYGLHITRLSSAEEKGVTFDARPTRSHEKRYAIRCEHCGKIYRREKRSKVITNYSRYRCGVCGGHLYPYDLTLELAAENETH